VINVAADYGAPVRNARSAVSPARGSVAACGPCRFGRRVRSLEMTRRQRLRRGGG